MNSKGKDTGSPIKNVEDDRGRRSQAMALGFFLSELSTA